jgi:mxaK protein
VAVRRALPVAITLLLAAIAIEGYRLTKLYSVNTAIESGAMVEGESPQAVFAQAYFQDRKGESQVALGLYHRVQNEADADQKIAAQYNSANILLRQAIETAKKENDQRALPTFELAKESYRAILRREPDHWDAKYNLERALRLSPEAIEGEAIGQNPDAERSVTTMRGFTLGLP